MISIFHVKSRQIKSSQVKTSQVKASQVKPRQGKARSTLNSSESPMIHPEHTGTGTRTASQAQISDLKSQISNATRRAGPERQWPKPRNRTKNQETSVHPHPHPCTRHPHPQITPTPTPFPAPSNHTYPLSQKTLKKTLSKKLSQKNLSKNLSQKNPRNSKLETHAHLRVTILPAAWHVSMSAARAAQSGSSVPANVALSLMLQIYVCVCAV